MAEQVYLSIFDKTTGTRKTSYTILGQIHGSTMDELKQKAAADYPNNYAVPQTAEEYHNGISGDLRWNGDTYTDPPQPTAEELQAQALASLDSEYQSRFDELDEQIVKAAALKNTELQDELIAERAALAEEYTQKRGEL